MRKDRARLFKYRNDKETHSLHRIIRETEGTINNVLSVSTEEHSNCTGNINIRCKHDTAKLILIDRNR